MIVVDYSLTPKQRLDNIKALELQTSPDGYYLNSAGEKIAFNGNKDLKPAYCTLSLTQKHIEEVFKCMNSVEYFFFNYCQIITNRGFNFGDTRQYQIDLLNFLGKEKRCCLTMPRQSSKSVTSGIHILHKILFNKDAYWGIAANIQGMSKEVLNKIKQTYLRLPIWLQQGVVSWNANSISLENGSRVLTSATTNNSFRGYTFATPGSGIMVDEVAFVSGQLWQDFYDAVMPTVSSSQESQIILCSTPKGLNHWFYIWRDAEEGKSEFKPYRIEWNDVPGRDEDWLNKQIDTFGLLYCRQNFLCLDGSTTVTVQIRDEIKEMSIAEVYKEYIKELLLELDYLYNSLDKKSGHLTKYCKNNIKFKVFIDSYIESNNLKNISYTKAIRNILYIKETK